MQTRAHDHSNNLTKPSVVFSLEDALDIAGGSIDLVKDLAQILIEEADSMLDALREAISKRDSHAVMVSAHTLKGAVSNLGAHQLRDTARTLETMGREDKLECPDLVLAKLEKQYITLEKRLRAL